VNSIWIMLVMAGLAKQQATDIANKTEMQLHANLAAYTSGVASPERKAEALRKFDETWERFTGPDGCGSATLRQYGERCISEREERGKFDWIRTYRQPIADSVIITVGPGGIGPPR